jgi:hypothetical protein
VTPRERVDMPAVDLFASIGRPVASGLKVKGIVEPEPPASVFAGTPVLLFGDAKDGGQIEIAWDGGGPLTLPVAFGSDATAETVRLLQGARLITDWESRYPSSEALAPLAKRQGSRVAMRLRELSQIYGLASREMSLIAVVKRDGDRPGELPETRVVPVGMPQDTHFSAYFPAPVMAGMPTGAPMLAQYAMSADPAMPAPPAPASGRKLFGLFDLGRTEPPAPPVPPPPPVTKVRVGAQKPRRTQPVPSTPEDSLLELAAALDSDGGMPGKDADTRAALSAVAVLAFLANGHTLSMGAFRSHVGRLFHFLESLGPLDREKRELVGRVLAAVRTGRPLPGDWMNLARSGSDTRSAQENDRWSALAKALAG